MGGNWGKLDVMLVFLISFNLLKLLPAILHLIRCFFEVTFVREDNVLEIFFRLLQNPFTELEALEPLLLGEFLFCHRRPED